MPQTWDVVTEKSLLLILLQNANVELTAAKFEEAAQVLGPEFTMSGVRYVALFSFRANRSCQISRSVDVTACLIPVLSHYSLVHKTIETPFTITYQHVKNLLCIYSTYSLVWRQHGMTAVISTC